MKRAESLQLTKGNKVTLKGRKGLFEVISTLIGTDYSVSVTLQTPEHRYLTIKCTEIEEKA